jgi:DNA-binding transcriptional MocR family regulator
MWRPDARALRRPVYLSLAEQIARAISDGRLETGARMPTLRALAKNLKIAVQTVSRAYQELDRRGLIAGEVGRGTFVRAPQREREPPFIPERIGEVIDLSILTPVCEAMHLERMAAALGSLAKSLPASAVLSFRPNVVFGRHRTTALKWLHSCGVETAPGNVIITNGATSGMTTALMTVAPPGSTVLTEEIGHHTLVPLATYLGLNLVGVRIDQEGIVPQALDRACRENDVRTLFIEPTAVNSTTTICGAARRAEIVDIARRHDITIIENDVLGPLIEKRPAPIAAQAPERTFYITSFTKCVVPGLRAGYLVVPDRLVPAAANRHLVTNWTATPLISEIATRWVEDGTAMELLLWQRETLRRRHVVAAEILRGIDYCSHADGLHIWLPLGGRWREQEFISHARLHGVAVAPGSAFAISAELQYSAVRISVGSTSEGALRKGLEIVAGVLKSDPEPALLTA